MPISHGNKKPEEIEEIDKFEREGEFSENMSKNSSKRVEEWMTNFFKNSMFGNVDIDTDSFFSEDDLWSERDSNKKTYQGSEWRWIC